MGELAASAMFRISPFQLVTNKPKKRYKSLFLIELTAAGYKYLFSGWKFIGAQAPKFINPW